MLELATDVFSRTTIIVPEKISIRGREKKSGHERVSFSPANKGVSRGREKKLVGSKVNGEVVAIRMRIRVLFENQDEEGARKTSPSRSPLMAPRIHRARLRAL